jgi:hypothetical protein
MHTIRLRDPWQISALPSTGDGSSRETNVPGDWSDTLGTDYRGQARYVRRFGLPTNLDPDERVFLVVGEVVEQATIMLNGSQLGRQLHAEGERRYEMTPLLQPRNELVIFVEARQALGGILGEVKLEICATDST